MGYNGTMANGLTPARRMVLLASVIVACGIDENGLEVNDASVSDSSSVDASNDAVKDVVTELPQSCTTLDVSACVDSGVPDGWAPIVANIASPTCPTTADYTVNAYGDNPQADGGCGCGCATKGSYSCAGTVTYWQQSCTNAETFDASDDGGCYATNGSHDFKMGSATVSDLGAGCTASNTSTPGSTTGDVTVCVPACTADYCGQTGVYHRCIWSATQTACPTPFTGPKDTIGSPTDVNVACTCGCTINKGSCDATIKLYGGGDTTCGTTSVGSVAVGTCFNSGGGTVDSFYYQPSVPTVACDASAPAPTATFNAPITVCCLP